jgi:exoribonuclease R
MPPLIAILKANARRSADTAISLNSLPLTTYSLSIAIDDPAEQVWAETL